jgi:hypothetical protein
MYSNQLNYQTILHYLLNEQFLKNSDSLSLNCDAKLVGFSHNAIPLLKKIRKKLCENLSEMNTLRINIFHTT